MWLRLKNHLKKVKILLGVLLLSVPTIMWFFPLKTRQKNKKEKKKKALRGSS